MHLVTKINKKNWLCWIGKETNYCVFLRSFRVPFSEPLAAQMMTNAFKHSLRGSGFYRDRQLQNISIAPWLDSFARKLAALIMTHLSWMMHLISLILVWVSEFCSHLTIENLRVWYLQCVQTPWSLLVVYDLSWVQNLARVYDNEGPFSQFQVISNLFTSWIGNLKIVLDGSRSSRQFLWVALILQF